MKLYYYRDRIGNFGDDLNPWLWYHVAPELFDDDGSGVLVGIGTLINSRAPLNPVKYVFGSGVGYHDLPVIDEKWKFVCVRGPLSAERLGLHRSKSITDPAVLLRQVVTGAALAGGIVSYMPHHVSARCADWRGICQDAGVRYLDPADDVHEIVFAIRQSRLVLAEAMHAAIVADAFRVPWIPIAAYDHILEFKWQDWCRSVGLEYRPVRIPSLWDIEGSLSTATLLKSRAKRALQAFGIRSDHWGAPVPRTNVSRLRDKVVQIVAQTAARGECYMSTDYNHRVGEDRLLETLRAFVTGHAISS